MTYISEENKYLTLINVFTVDPSNQQKLIDLLTMATSGSVTKITGFVSSSLHRSLDGTKVTMYAQWRSLEDYQNMRNNPSASQFLTGALEIATFEPGSTRWLKHSFQQFKIRNKQKSPLSYFAVPSYRQNVNITILPKLYLTYC